MNTFAVRGGHRCDDSKSGGVKPPPSGARLSPAERSEAVGGEEGEERGEERGGGGMENPLKSTISQTCGPLEKKL